MSAKAIVQKYISNHNFQKFWKDIIEDWPLFSTADRTEIFHFLYNSFQFKTLLALLVHDLSMVEPAPPWDLFFYTLKKFNIKVPPNHASAFAEHFSITRTPQGTLPSAKTLADAFFDHKRAVFEYQLEERKQNLLSRYNIAQAEHLVQQQKEYRDQMERLSSLKNQNNFLKKASGDTETTASKTETPTTSSKPQPHNLTPSGPAMPLHQEPLSHQSAREKLTIERQESTKNNPEEEALEKSITAILEKHINSEQDAIDGALVLYFCGLPNQSAALLGRAYKRAKNNDMMGSLFGTKGCIYLLEFLFQGQMYLELISLHRDLQTSRLFPQDLVLQKTAEYYLGLSYWSLGERERAIGNLMKVKRLDPNFKETLSLLENWTEAS